GLMALSAVMELDMVLGAFAAGIIVRALAPGNFTMVEGELRTLGFSFLIPLFFVTSGMNISLNAVAGYPFLLVAFVGAILVIAALVPYEDAGLDESPFVTVFDIAGISGMGDVMNFVIIAALLSAGNSGLFSCTRMLHSMAAEGQAPKAFLRTTKRGIPMLALCVSMVGGVASLLSSEIAPSSLYMILVSIAGFAVGAVWIAIAASQLSFRRRFLAAGGEMAGLHYRAPASRVLAWLSIIALVASLIGVGFDADQREALTVGFPFTVICLVYYRWRHGAGCFTPQGQDAELDAAVTASSRK
ncbi:MAG: cation:proton antiporter, partial [Corynebacterium variabile]